MKRPATNGVRAHPRPTDGAVADGPMTTAGRSLVAPFCQRRTGVWAHRPPKSSISSRGRTSFFEAPQHLPRHRSARHLLSFLPQDEPRGREIISHPMIPSRAYAQCLLFSGLLNSSNNINQLIGLLQTVPSKTWGFFKRYQAVRSGLFEIGRRYSKGRCGHRVF
jgi:hypothetical protein